MTLPVFVTPDQDRFVAVLAGAPEVRGAGRSRDEAIAALKADFLRRSQQGELLWVDFDQPEGLRLAGSFSDDPTLRELCAEIYRQRDAELQP